MDGSVSCSDDSSLHGTGQESSHGFEPTTNRSDHDDVKEVEAAVRKETRRVIASRYLVIAMILATAGITTGVTYVYLDDENKEDFRAAFKLNALTIANAAQYHMNNVVDAARGMSASASAHAIASGSEWPFVTLPEFEVNAAQRLKASGGETVYFLPLLQGEHLEEWKTYSMANKNWLDDSYATRNIEFHNRTAITPFSWEIDFKALAEGQFSILQSNDESFPFVAPSWQLSPPPLDPLTVNWNFLSTEWMRGMVQALLQFRGTVLLPSKDASGWLQRTVTTEEHDAAHFKFLKKEEIEPGYAWLHPHSLSLTPVFRETGNPESDIVAIMAFVLPWDNYLQGLLPDGISGIQVVLRSTCGGGASQNFTYEIDGKTAHYLGDTDMHDIRYDDMEFPIYFSPVLSGGRNKTINEFDCLYSFSVYPSRALESTFNTSTPKRFALIVGFSFCLMALTFFLYERFLKTKNTKMVATAARSNKIVSSLFPEKVRDRLMAETDAKKLRSSNTTAAKDNLKGFLDDVGESEARGSLHNTGLVYKEKPIADLFTDTTILFADICGFTAWSSVREPSQVFTLLETIYAAFDDIARKRRVYKVETIGDCYVAVTGLPEPKKDHAVAMGRFAKDCLDKMHVVAKRLEPLLGPDTSDLSMRFGLHSGSVTAGVLRGDRSRFQLFGDAMNTAARMEHTGARGRIQVSQETADVLTASGKAHWLTKRKDVVVAKGKGRLQTYWLNPTSSGSRASLSAKDETSVQGGGDCSIEFTEVPDSSGLPSSKVNRLVEWSVQVLRTALKQIVARRGGSVEVDVSGLHLGRGSNQIIDEVKEIIELPSFSGQSAKHGVDPVDIVLPDNVESQLVRFVENIAAMYRNNAFHSFEHASHVTMSVTKLLGRIVTPNQNVSSKHIDESMLHDHTFGIVSDPVTQFACIFSGLIHDVDHSGVSNEQLVKEKDAVAVRYKNKSVAEQHSVELSWNLLMQPEYSALRGAIYSTPAEMERFRQLVVNSVMATDILDKNLKLLRNIRWERAFDGRNTENSVVNTHRKATIVIEHLIQASDVAHTMQHWHVYRKWNENLFAEMNFNFQAGRADVDPALNWYEGELGFFDFYIIPLAKKLKECGVFGVSSDEYLNYAMNNRREWKERGAEIVAEMVQRYQTK